MRRHLTLIVLGLIAASPASAFDLPARKAGLWLQKTTLQDRRPQPSFEQCIDAATDKNLIGDGIWAENCSERQVRKVGSTIVVDTVCQGLRTITAQTVITGDFNSAYTMKVTLHSGKAVILGMQTEGGSSEMTVEAKWQGPCKPGQEPGDVILEDG